jgi:uncharacterized repeat protein (TIGR01451 family)
MRASVGLRWVFVVVLGLGVLLVPSPALAANANLSVTMTGLPDVVSAGSNITYTITVANSGQDPATSPTLSDSTPDFTTFVSVSPTGGWTCPTTPVVGRTGAVTCSGPTLASGSSVTITLVVNVINSSVVAGGTISNTAIASSPDDPSSGKDRDTGWCHSGGSQARACIETSVHEVEEEDPGRLCAMAGAIKGTNGSDTLIGTSGNDIICGGNGSDTIDGLGGNDTIFGQNGQDVLNGSDGNDNVIGGSGQDQVTGGAGTDMLMGGNGNDVLNSQDGASGDSLDDGNGSDTCQTDTGDTTANCP